jgi:integrase
MRPVSNGEGTQTVNDLAALFLSRLNVRPRTEYEYRRMLRFDVLPALGSKPVAAIVRADIFTVLDRITGRGARIIANRTHQLLVALLNVAVDRGWVAVNVARGIRRPGGREKPRERALTLVELARIWRATGELRPATRDVIRLLMLTAARRSEVHGMRWEELIGPAGAAMWRIPGSRMKNGRELSRHLSGPAVTILEGYEQQESGKVFTRVPMDLAGVVKELCARCGITPPAHVHDIRRSVATVMATQDTPPHVLRLILGHVDSSMLARYNVHKYEIEAADAYERFAKALLFQVERMQFKQAETAETTGY